MIHFGRERGRRTGRLRLINDTIVSPFSTPVVLLDGEGVSAELSACKLEAIKTVEGGPFQIRSSEASPAYRWKGNGRWEPTKDRFIGAG